MKQITFHELSAPVFHPDGDAWNADDADNIAAEGIGFSMIRFERFSVALSKAGGLSHSAEHICDCGAHLGKAMAAITPEHGRLKW